MDLTVFLLGAIVNSYKRLACSLFYFSGNWFLFLSFKSGFMADVHDANSRSYNMSRIKSKDTKPEMLVRKYLHSQGFRYRLHVRSLPGSPDLVLPRYKTVIFIHGCFWHQHINCRFARVPGSNSEYWTPKLKYNVQRDAMNVQSLARDDWRVIVIWECDLKKKNRENTLQSLKRLLNSERL